MHAFGHVGYAHTPEQKRVKGDKFAPRAVKAHLVGMVGDHIYQMWIPDTGKIITTASVKFNGYGAQLATPNPIQTPPSSPLVAPIAPLLRQMTDAAGPLPQAGGSDPDDFQLPRVSGGDDFDGLSDDDDGAAPPPPPVAPTRGNNVAPCRHDINADLDEAHIIQGLRLRVRAHFSSATFDRCFAMALIKPTFGSKLSDLPPEPRNWKSFKNHPRRADLQIAMDDEYDALIANATWRPATLQEIADHEVIPGQWVWTYKGDAQGNHIKDKARIVACGNKQQESI
jgi:hypothetical protein